MPEIEPAPAGDAEAPAEPRGAAKGKGRRPAARKPAPRAEGKAAEKPEKAAKPAKPARPRSRGRSDKG